MYQLRRKGARAPYKWRPGLAKAPANNRIYYWPGARMHIHAPDTVNTTLNKLLSPDVLTKDKGRLGAESQSQSEAPVYGRSVSQ